MKGAVTYAVKGVFEKHAAVGLVLFSAYSKMSRAHLV